MFELDFDVKFPLLGLLLNLSDLKNTIIYDKSSIAYDTNIFTTNIYFITDQRHVQYN